MQLRPTAILMTLAAALTALALSTLTGNRATAQFSIAGHAARVPWPPPPEDIVNVGPLPSTTLAAGQSATIYSVPSDRWLVLTEADHYQMTLDRKLGASLITMSSVGEVPFGDNGYGIAFPPGSQVVYTNHAALPAQFSGNLYGYLTTATEFAQSLVTIDVANFNPDPSNFVTLPIGGSLAVYTVPHDRWLVIDQIYGATSFNAEARIAEQLPTGTFDRARVFSIPHTHPIGLSFHPGSTVLITNASGAPLAVQFELRGYLAAP